MVLKESPPFRSSASVGNFASAMFVGIRCSLLLASFFFLRGCAQNFGQTRFICTSVPVDMDMCTSSVQTGGSTEDLKTTVLQLRETVLQQKETIMNQKETIRELTTKLGRCESQSSLETVPGQKDNRPTDKFQLTFPLRTNYMYAKVKKSLPEMYAFTICMWIKSNASPGVGTPFSYAVPGQANELVLIEWGNNPMEILINDKVAKLPFVINDGKWHHICITWTTRDGVWEAFQDGALQGNGENLAPYHPIKPQGVLVLGQEQDTLGGGFDATQAFVGELAHFNIWDRKLTPGEIYNLATCSTKALSGSVIAWSETNIDIYGGATKWTFEACRQIN
ncbi:neuronal pentraxin-1 isoform X2 [Sphaerodactylus townsendi]|uniref:neuronal pentraxin-1 isoform X2 n=1 Tax=Sphaerodactylus townsendi TaxID=933632 RepID=UPI0020275669|nr:neuronal pentraxin-1 isoform X2 [Sphaerodactylus townsendi]